ncbi:glycosyltransferase family 2 protein [Cohnella caldifontis]|uniref:glycosyltransferase family 2 protein n=1 Tax=Cohnella caldifontis TaxID=3027471 RepID=UPI0023EBA815|nr:glycosyltransferase [Cohnella sp. YIM B05605]
MNDRLSVIIPAGNEALSIGNVIREARRLGPFEIIAVVNGSSDGTAAVCRSMGCRVAEYGFALGHDVGRGIGACLAEGDILLFLDADIPIPADRLAPFVQAIRAGCDIALNQMSRSLALSEIPHYTAAAKTAFNRMLGRPELSVNSLVAVPHAMSRKAAETIGFEHLANPCLAQAIASAKGMRFACPAEVDVIGANRPRKAHIERCEGSVYPRSTTRILGDHLEALGWLIRRYGPRGGLPEGARDRGFLRHYAPPPARGKAKRSAVIPAMEENRTILPAIRSVRAAGVDEIIVVANGADDATVAAAMTAGARVMVFSRPLGHNVGRAIGAACATGDVCLFVDGDFALPPRNLVPFLRAAENGTDIALNDLAFLFRRFRPADPISTVKYFLNVCLNRPELLNNSLTAVPHAMTRGAIARLGWETLVIPPLAQAKAVLEGLSVRAVHSVDVVAPNRVREDHKAVGRRIPAFERIVGDHLEAVDYLLKRKGERGGFRDTERDRDMITAMKGRIRT